MKSTLLWTNTDYSMGLKYQHMYYYFLKRHNIELVNLNGRKIIMVGGEPDTLGVRLPIEMYFYLVKYGIYK